MNINVLGCRSSNFGPSGGEVDFGDSPGSMKTWKEGGREAPKRGGLLNGAGLLGVTDGIRTHDNQNHNLGLYQLSYGHH